MSLQLQPHYPQTFPVGLDPTKTFFVDGNGKPCFACGDAPQILPNMLGYADLEFYLSDRVQRGINIGWMILADNVYQTSPPNNVFGNAPFSVSDFTNFNSNFWSYIDYIVQRCLTNGFTVMAMPAFMGLTGSQGYQTSWKAASDATLQGYASFLGNRYKSYPNLMWVLGGDADPADTALYAKLNTFGTALKSADPGHLIALEASRFTGGSAAPNGGYSSIDACGVAIGSTPSWLDINWVYQTGTTVLSGAQRCYSQGKPCLLGEDWYELENGETVAGVRGEGYFAVLGGCTLGRLFANGIVWGFGSPNSNGNSPTWQSQIPSSATIGQQLMGKLFRSRAFHKLVPDISNVVMTVGSAGGSACARTSDGQSIIAYIPSNQTITIDMSKITDSGSQANCNWYNPQTGGVTAIGNISTVGTHNFTSPDSNDWVLVVDSAAANLRSPGT